MGVDRGFARIKEFTNMTAKARGRLTEAKVLKLVKPGRYCDGDSLYLQISNVSGRLTRAYILRYVSPLIHPSGQRVDAKGQPKPWVRDFGLSTTISPRLANALRRPAINCMRDKIQSQRAVTERTVQTPRLLAL
jgi:hypothetical protein